MVDLSLRNRKVAFNRWNKEFIFKTQNYLSNTHKFLNFKARILGYLMGDGSVTIRRERIKYIGQYVFIRMIKGC